MPPDAVGITQVPPAAVGVTQISKAAAAAEVTYVSPGAVSGACVSGCSHIGA